MPKYNFQKEVEVYVVTLNTSGNPVLKYKLDVSSITFSQSFAQENYRVNTLHAGNDFFEGSVINKANPAQFSFNMPLLKDSDFDIVFNLLVDNDTTESNLITDFDLYVVALNNTVGGVDVGDVFQLNKSVITNGSFVIERSRPLRLEISGEASKLIYRSDLNNGVGVPGTLQSRSSSLRYISKPAVSVSFDSQSLSNIISASIELQNEVQWTPYTTVHGSLSATDSSNSMYPSEFSLDKRVLSGSVNQYITESKGTGTQSLQNWSASSPMILTAGNGTGSSFRGISVDGNCSFTNRIGSGSVYTQSFDWRLIDNSSSLNSILTYSTGA